MKRSVFLSVLMLLCGAGCRFVSSVDVDEKARLSVADTLQDDSFDLEPKIKKIDEEKKAIRILREHTREPIIGLKHSRKGRIEITTGEVLKDGNISNQKTYRFKRYAGTWELDKP